MKRTWFYIILVLTASFIFIQCEKDENTIHALDCSVYYFDLGEKLPVEGNEISISLVPAERKSFLRLLTNKEGKIHLLIDEGLFFVQTYDCSITEEVDDSTIIRNFIAPEKDTVYIDEDLSLEFELTEVFEDE